MFMAWHLIGLSFKMFEQFMIWGCLQYSLLADLLWVPRVWEVNSLASEWMQDIGKITNLLLTELRGDTAIGGSLHTQHLFDFFREMACNGQKC